jgi:hypothetical protein
VKPHKRAGAAVQITTSIPRDRLASLCKQALSEESERWLRVDKDSPEELIFGLRGPYREASRQLLWRVDIHEADGRTSLQTRITGYEQEQHWPMPATMRGLPRYEKWMRRVADHVRADDPAAQVTFAG